MITLADRYKLGDKIGTGGMGNIYRAEDTFTGNTVAIKALKQSLIKDDDLTVLERFLREAGALRQLAHPNIVKILDSFEQEQQHFIVMEYLPGGSLRDRVNRDGPLPVEIVVRICLELADALTRAHDLGIIHRDIKPENVLLADDNTPRLTDFGLAQISHASVLTSGSMVMGTLPYLSPEALNGEPQDTHADIWAFGVMLYELLAGIRPFRGDQTGDLIRAIVMQAPDPDLETLRPDVPAALSDLINHMLEKDPDKRIVSVRKIGAALDDIKHGRDGHQFYASPVRSAIRTLPVVPTSFIGRETDIAEISKLVTSPDHRLITLIGPGGIGKTRLALEVAGRVPDNVFSNGVRFVELAPVQSVENIVPTIATAVGYQFPQSEDPDERGGIVTSNEDQLMDFFSQKNMLLVMDNAEHLADSVFLFERILTEAPDVTILVTSRVPLNSQWEYLYEVSGLPVDRDAVDLFVDRAVQVQPRFDLQNEAPCVSSICELMEGLPLGLELAATWLRVMSCQELTDELLNNLSFLESRQRTVDQRHASLQVVFEQSWRLLTDAERDALMRMSVFKGSFTRNAAQEVAGAGLPILTALVDQSLVQVTPEGRYRLHELVRQLSATKFAENLDVERETLHVHADYYSHLIEQQLPRLKSGEMPEALRDIDTDIDNVRAAWHHAIAVHDAAPIQRMAESLHHYFVFRAYHSEGIDLYQSAIEAFDGEEVAVAVQVYQSRFYLMAKQYDRALQLVESIYDHVEALNNQRLLAIALSYRGLYLERAGEQDDARPYLERALSLYRLLGDDFEAGNVNRFLALLYLNDDDTMTLAYFEENYRLAKKCGSQYQLAHSTLTLGTQYWEIGQTERVLELYQQGLEYARQFGHVEFMSTFLTRMGGLQQSCFGDYAEANRLFQEALTVAREAGHMGMVASSLGPLGWNAYKQRQYVLAKKYWEEVVELATLVGSDRLLRDTFGYLAMLEGMKGNFEQRVHYSEKSIEISRRLGHQTTIALEYGNLAYGAFHAGRYVDGKRFGEQALAIWQELPDISRPFSQASAHVNLAHNLLELGERRRALENFRCAIDMELQITDLTHEIVAGVAKAMTYVGDLGTAIKLLRFILNADKLGDHQRFAQRDYNDLIAELPEDVVEDLLAEADELTHEEAVDIMLNHPIWREHRLDQPLIDPLSERELEVLALVAKGKSNRQIAEELFVAKGTIRTHVHNIMGKLDAQNRTEAVAKAQELGIL